MPIHRLAQPRTHNVGVDLGGADIGMPQHYLYAAQVRAAFQQMGGEGMPENVGA